MTSTATTDPHEHVGPLVAHVFRHGAGRILASLTRVFGPERMDLAEDVVQEALLRALRRWPYGGIPDDPESWLARVARNLAIDRLRGHASSRTQTLATESAGSGRGAPDEAPCDELQDDVLRMMFTCCHPAIPREPRVALTLKALGGFGVDEIAAAFLARPAAIAQRLVRAKRRLREEAVGFCVPAPGELRRRLDSVLEAIYLIFNEGYASHGAGELIRRDLVDEALRLTGLLLAHPDVVTPKVRALAALMCFQAARLPARVDGRGELLLLAEQDRSLWDRDLIQRGFFHLEGAMAGDRLSTYHLEAGIAACHAAADDFDGTDWRTILDHYDALVTLAPTPVVALNRAVAVTMVDGAAAGLAALEPLAGDRELRSYYLLPATRAELLRRLGRRQEAAEEFERALELAVTGPERGFLKRRRDECRAS